MNSLRALEAELPPGFRFQPRDDELICDYLMKKAVGCTPRHTPFLIQVDLNSCEPWDIPEFACVGGKAWYFYSQRDKKYANGLRTNRATLSGYWKATGKDRPVTHEGILVGMRKTLVFYHGRAPKGTKTDWVMHEFRLEWKVGPGPLAVSYVQECTREDWVLCRVFQKNTKQHAESGFGTNSSSPPISLPPSMEPYNTLGPFQANYYHEQVPFFSFFNTNPCQPPLQTQLDRQISPINVTPNSAGLTPILGGICPHYSDPSRDKNVIQAVLGHFTKMRSFDNDSCVEGSSCSGDQELSESFLPRSELDSIWN